jgi:lipoate-protein ligase A
MTSMPSRLLPKLNILRLNQMPILRQLQLEEALLRVDGDNWFVYNEGLSAPSIVLGLSGKPDKMLHLDLVEKYDLIGSFERHDMCL